VPKPYGPVTERLLSLSVGKSCVVDVRRPDRQLATVRKYAPDRRWSVQSIDGRKVVTRVG